MPSHHFHNVQHHKPMPLHVTALPKAKSRAGDAVSKQDTIGFQKYLSFYPFSAAMTQPQ